MATINRHKLNSLYTELPSGAPLTADALKALGISADLAVHYVRSGWLTRLARGVYCRKGDTLALNPSLRLLERQVAGLHVFVFTLRQEQYRSPEPGQAGGRDV